MYRLFGNAPVGRSDENPDERRLDGNRKSQESQRKIRKTSKEEKSAEPRKRLSAQRPLAAAKNGARGYAWPGANSYCTVALDASQRRVAWGMKRGKITESGGGKQ
ncbi:MAG: hypothetical protein WAT60_04935 [Bifidobacterium adolescentis]